MFEQLEEKEENDGDKIEFLTEKNLLGTYFDEEGKEHVS